MIERRFPRSHLFMLELVIVICFFSVAAVICLQAFGRAKQLTADSAALSGAVAVVQSRAEELKAQPLAQLPDNGEPLYYTENWQQTTANKAAFVVFESVSLQPQSVGTMALFEIQAKTSEKTLIYQLQAAKYYPGGGAVAKTN